MVAPPQVAPEGEPLLEVEIPLVSFDGVWLDVPQRYVRVFNDGDVAIYPTIEWQGEGASVRWPSGMVTQLPPVKALSTLDTSPWGGFTVRTGGKVNVEASKAVAGFSEPALPGEGVRVVVVNGQAIWRVARWSPWV